MTQDLITPEQINVELARICADLDRAHQRVIKTAKTWVNAEDELREAKAHAFAQIRKRVADGEFEDKLTAAEREALMEASIKDEVSAEQQAKLDKENAVEWVRSLRAQLSAVQSMGATVRSEMALAGQYE